MAGTALQERTKGLMADALETIVERTGKPIEKVTVTELCEEAGVNRKTFYYHFKDIEDLAVWAFQKSGKTIAKNCDFVKAPEASIRYFVSYVAKHGAIYVALADHFGLDRMKQMGFQDAKIFVIPESFRTITSNMKEQDHGEVEFLEFGARFFAEAICDVMYHHLKSDEPRWSADQIADYSVRVWHAAAMPIIENKE